MDPYRRVGPPFSGRAPSGAHPIPPYPPSTCTHVMSQLLSSKNLENSCMSTRRAQAGVHQLFMCSCSPNTPLCLLSCIDSSLPSSPTSTPLPPFSRHGPTHAGRAERRKKRPCITRNKKTHSKRRPPPNMQKKELVYEARVKKKKLKRSSKKESMLNISEQVSY